MRISGRKISAGVDNVDLAHAHCGDGGVVRSGGDARAALRVERDGHFRIERFL